MESWVEVNLQPTLDYDARLLTDLVDPLVHDVLAGHVETWFFFWEPELRLRIRWRDEPRETALFTALDVARERGLIAAWAQGGHGDPSARYTGEAELYGDEMWPLVQKDWMNGSELAVRLAREERAGTLTRPREFHWKRHTHLFTNQLYGTWESEVELCLAQAHRYLELIRRHGGSPTAATAKLAAELARLANDP